ncbi:ubiquinol-cytochrome c reductase iron-sulfur subunit [Polynucleobacter sp. IMCC30063]|uniref:ubiquinol-cytochrome c reductase iron-sulfur subunit n=1 Tax=unclassified Polynucleobacter TaxID=2640945 RepID=UPI001F40E770|nr:MULTISPECIES: ubiquinol-cytochrome c reductase iron-sulfur subunit [unclassified Polynucleobacter]MCE7505003.1 ubiquinol-cytochrome c reductase iron-sulfur subunit [Polynucleobacter sp. IMCC30063]MCE7526205.1 ubiquinol-cytochrome c reductase iron-sulfur subunit [Polynucleobacter sp. IMCC 30228]MCE7528511.1 ubiquinol-cytochrome c reductase iron-sulfur subunit [Polynucleobacter sp. IMCC 29146]
MSDQPSTDTGRRNWLIATSVVGGIGGAVVLVPFVTSFQPSERAKAAGAPVEVDISGMKPDEVRTVEWRGKPVWVVRRTPEQVAELPKNDPELADPNSLRNQDTLTPPYARNQYRSIKPEYFVAVGICTHLGCSPSAKFESGAQPSLPNNWPGGWFCPCHGSTFDFAGRVYKNKPAPDNLEVPPHKYLSDTMILIGDDAKA